MQRSLDLLRATGYTVAITEHFNAFSRTKNDMFGWIDILALKGNQTLAVQTTSRPNISTRVAKIAESDTVAAIRAAGWSIVVHGWDRGPDKKWRVRVVDLS